MKFRKKNHAKINKPPNFQSLQ